MSSTENASLWPSNTRQIEDSSCVDASIGDPGKTVAVGSPPAMSENLSEDVRFLLTSVPPEILRGSYTTMPGDRPKPGLDQSLPPISRIEDIFEDLTARALKNGFDSFIDHIDSRELRVATMCSGTESPLLALEMIQDSLRRLLGKTFQLKHLFSAEIDAYKQSYIQRNFAPDIIFRDVNELVADEATTAFGSLREVPTDPDLLVVGFSCVDFSALNFYRKTLEDMGESGHTFYGVLRYIQRCRPPLVVLENVCSAPWEQIKTILKEIDYHGYHMKIDSKNFYLPQTRERGYMICIDQRKLVTDPVGDSKSKKLSPFAQMMKNLERPASSPVTHFLLGNDDIRFQDAISDISFNSTKDRLAVDWTRYKARHLGYRMREGLGDKRPLTKWQDNGTCQMPDFYWHDWSRIQTERVWDTLDVNFLRTTARGYDISSKSRVIDLSQGLDRELDQRASGIAGCLTPRGQHFITSRGGPLLGIEALALQGIPIDKLLISNDSQRDLHDLAGNAMTSTVVGAAIITALTLGHQALSYCSASSMTEKTSPVIPPDFLKQSDLMIPIATDKTLENTLSTADIVQLASKSSKLCYCENQLGTRTDNILFCTLCFHTACSKCGKNPTHSYERMDIKDLTKRISPIEFQFQMKSALPMRLQINGLDLGAFDQLRRFTVREDTTDIWNSFSEAMELTIGDVLQFRDITRQSGWTITYEGRHSLLQLCSSSRGLQWSLYATPSKYEPSNSPLRQILSRPIAKMIPSDGSVLLGTWLVGSPLSSQILLDISGRGDLVESLPARSGLQHPNFQNLKTWSVLHIDAKNEEIEDLEMDIRGDYQLLPNCGAAGGSLRKRSSTSGNPIFLFLDPTEIGPHQLDSWVFAIEHGRLGIGQSRSTIAEIRPNWNPLYLGTDEEAVQCWYRKWEQSPAISLDVYRPLAPPKYSIPDPSLVSARCKLPCASSYTTILHCSIPAGRSEFDLVSGVWEQEDLSKSTMMLQKYAWLLQKGARITNFENWVVVDKTSIGFDTNCRKCAPQKPRLAWALDDKDRVYAYENPEDAATFERGIKDRPSPFVGFSALDDSSVFHLKICLNVPSLLHRAIGNLASADNSMLQWRLCLDTTGFTPQRLPKLLEKNNKLDQPHAQPPNFKSFPLRPEQLRSLQWMRNQESDTAPPFEEEEVAEALLASLNWRAEAKASAKKTVSGGILGDEVGYGKTAISLGLIDVQFQKDCTTIPVSVKGKIPIGATLILIPNHLFDQWRREIYKFLGNTYKILEIKSVSSCGSITIGDFEASDIVLASSSLLKGTAYYAMMECFAATPEIPKGEGRIFKQWLDDALNLLSRQVDHLVNCGALGVLNNVRSSQLWQRDEVSKYRPSKRLKGQRFQEHLLKMREVNQNSPSLDIIESLNYGIGENVVLGKRKRELDCSPKEEATASTQAPKNQRNDYSKDREKSDLIESFGLSDSGNDWRNVRSPLLHMFEFNRIIIDEFTYSKDRIYAATLSIPSRKKWILSGTPPLNNFADVKSFSPFLDINLGIDEDDGRKVENERLKTIQRERTEVEKFQPLLTRRSTIWHLRRHEIAQKFLDQFMRKNIPDIHEIPWTEHIITVSLSVAERAVYLELFMQLMSQNLRMRKHGRGLYDTDESARLDEIIGDSSSPEEALSKRCSLFTFTNATPPTSPRPENISKEVREAKDSLTVMRRQQLSSLAADIVFYLKQGLWLRNQLDEGTVNFDRFLVAIEHDKIGDVLVTNSIKKLLQGVTNRANSNDGALFYREKKAPADDLRPEYPKSQIEFISDLNYCTDNLRRLVSETVSHTRALRLYQAVKCFQNPPVDANFICYSCGLRRNDPQVFSILGECGHSACETCLLRCKIEERCLLLGCSGIVHGYRIIGWPDVFSPGSNNTPDDEIIRYGGSKFTEIINLIQNKERIPSNDQVLLFIQFPELMNAAASALKLANIPHIVVQPGDRTHTSKISRFQNGKEIVKSKVLILNLGDVTASGLNLQNANHLIFLGPLISCSQYDYNSGMAQAIGRCRRYGQSKHVHIYHVLVLKTIEVNIFEQRRRQILAKRGDRFVMVPKSEVLDTDKVDWRGFPLEGSNAEAYEDD